MNWLDWLIVVIIVWSAWQGLRRGLLVSLARMAGLLAGLFVAYSQYRPLADYLSVRWNFENLLAPITKPLLKLYQPVVDIVSPFSGSGNQLPAEQQITSLLTYSILEIISFLVLLVLTAVLVGSAGRFLTDLIDFSFLSPLNSLGGLLFGFLKGVLIIVIAFALISPYQQGAFFQDPAATPGITAPTGNAFKDSMLITYFQPFVDILKLKLPDDIPYKNILPGSGQSI